MVSKKYSEASVYVKHVRLNKLKLSQAEFAEYLNKNNEVEATNLKQSTISKYESKSYAVPADILLHCLNIQESIHSKVEYPVENIVQQIKKLDPIKDFKLFELIELIVQKKKVYDLT